MAEATTAFLCDAMLGGLARWLRAAGHDAEYHYGIDDGKLPEIALSSGRVLLSSDSRLFDRNVIRRGQVRAIFVPRGMSKMEQLRFVVRSAGLRRRQPRCMACGGELVETPKHTVMDEAPPLAFRRCSRFWRCAACGKLFWHGTHWERITGELERELGPIPD